jgi:hypothetical protein
VASLREEVKSFLSGSVFSPLREDFDTNEGVYDFNGLTTTVSFFHRMDAV